MNRRISVGMVLLTSVMATGCRPLNDLLDWLADSQEEEPTDDTTAPGSVPPTEDTATGVSYGPCDSLDLGLADPVPLEVTTLRYGAFELGPHNPESRFILEDTAAWDQLVAEVGTDGGLSPEFGNESIYIHFWVDGGCDVPYTYTAWAWDDVQRVLAWQEVDGDCDAWFPTLDLVSVPRGVSADRAWCG